MFTLKNVSAGQAGTYYQADDYYTERGEMPSRWGGSIAAELGLHGDFDNHQFRRALLGHFDGQEWKQRPAPERAALDACFSAPKSVSVLALVAGRREVLDAHDHAVTAAMAKFEKLARVRVTEKGKTTSREARGIAFASFRHETSREGDPQLHTHNVIFKGVLSDDGKLRSLDNRQMYRAQKLADAIYKQELAARLRGLGYSLERDKNGFEVAGVSRELCAVYSKRSNAIEDALGARGLDRASAGAASRQAAALETRDTKKHVDRGTLRHAWTREAGRAGHDVQGLADRAHAAGRMAASEVVVDVEKDAARPREALRAAVEHVTEREQVIYNPYTLKANAIHAADYRESVDAIDRELNATIDAGELIQEKNRERGRLTTHEGLRAEKTLRRVYITGVDKADPIADRREAHAAIERMESTLKERSGRPDASMTDGQKRLVSNVLTSRDRVLICEGDAGTGKTTSMEAIQGAAQAAGYKVLGLAPSGQAVQSLRGAGIDTQTAQRADKDTKFWDQVDNKTLVLIDEAGLVGVKALARTLQRAEERGARVLLVGDDKQFGSVEAGRGLYLLQEAAGTRASRLDDMRRGGTAEMRELHRLARDHTDEAIEQLLSTRCMVHAQASKRHEAIATDYAAVPATERPDVLVLAGTNAERRQINGAIRAVLGFDDSATVKSIDRKDLTQAQLKDSASYEEGDIVTLNSRTRDGAFEKNERLRVTGKAGDQVTVESLTDGQVRQFSPRRHGAHAQLGTEENLPLAVGERIRFTARDRKQNIENGDKGTVEALDAGSARVRLDDGRSVDVNLNDGPVSMRHAYCVTGHSAQGGKAKLVLRALTSADPTIDMKSEYTNITRAVADVRIYTDAKGGRELEQLRNAVTVARDKSSAHDVVTPKDEQRFEGHAYLAPKVGLERIELNSGDTQESIHEKLTLARERWGDIFVAGSERMKRSVADAVLSAGEKDQIRFTNPDMRAVMHEREEERAAALERVNQRKDVRREVPTDGTKRNQTRDQSRDNDMDWSGR